MTLSELWQIVLRKARYHQAELTPDDAKRRARRDRYNEIYDCCEHGEPRESCPGRDDEEAGC